MTVSRPSPRTLAPPTDPAATVRAGSAPTWLVDCGIAGLLLLLALAVRWWDLGGQSGAMWGDEARFMSMARSSGQGLYSSPFAVDYLALPAFFDFMLSLPLRVAGYTNLVVARGFIGLIGALGAPLLYQVARELGYPRRVGVVAGVVLATLHWDVMFSRMVLPNVTSATGSCALLLLLIMAVRRSSVVYAALAGVALAWTLNAHLSGTMLLPVMFVWLALMIVAHGRWRLRSWGREHPARPEGDQNPLHRQGNALPQHRVSLAHRLSTMLRAVFHPPGCEPHLDLDDAHPRASAIRLISVALVFAATGIACDWPLLQSYLAPNSALVAHSTEHYLLTAANRAAFAVAHPGIGTSLLGLLWYQFNITIGMFSVMGDPDNIYNVPGRPLLDAVSGLLLCIGLAGSLLRIRRPSTELVLLWFAVPIVLGVTLSAGRVLVITAPTFTRAMPAIPALCLLIALGMEYAVAGVCRAVQRVWRWPGSSLRLAALRVSLLVMVTGIVGVVEVQRYWDYVRLQQSGPLFHTAGREWSMFLAPRGAIQVTVVGPAAWPPEYTALYAPTARICVGLWVTSWGICPPAQVVIFDMDRSDAQAYGARTHLRVVAGPSEDSTTRFWYADGHNLPDPARVLQHAR